MSLARFWGLVFSAFLTASAAGEALAQETSQEQRCPEEANLVSICERNACALYRVEDIAPGRVVSARGAAVFAPPGAGSAMRWWGGSQELLRDREPVFIIPWKQPPKELLPSLRARYEEWAKCPHEKHHIFPQALKAQFERQGIKIHLYTMWLLVEDHHRIHRGARGGAWNEAWRQFFEVHLTPPTREEIFRFAGELIYRFELFGPVMPYYRGSQALCPNAAK